MFCLCVLIIAAAAVYMVEAYIHTYYAIEYMTCTRRSRKLFKKTNEKSESFLKNSKKQ